MKMSVYQNFKITLQNIILCFVKLETNGRKQIINSKIIYANSFNKKIKDRIE